MNRLSPLTLPRFDVKALSRTARTHQSHTEAPQGQSEYSDEPVVAEADPQQEQPFPPDLQAPLTPKPDPVDTGVLLASLEASVAEMERSAVVTCHQALADFFASAFPRLNEAFLATEITTALESMAPPQIEKLNLRIPSTLEASFRQALQNSARLSEVCELHPVDSPTEMVVDVDWRDGGLQFDMDQFLNSTLGRLSGLQNT